MADRPSSGAPATAFWLAKPGRGELRTTTLPDPGPGEARVAALASAVSRGSESIVFNGQVPLTQYAAMRCPFQDGEFPGPVKYGYASVGLVEAVGPGVPETLVGRRVFCHYPHQDRYIAPADAIAPIPDEVPAERASLAANMETAVNGLWDGGPRVGDRIVVVGAGVVGCLFAAVASGIPATEVTLVDVDPDRRHVADRLDVSFAMPSDAPGAADLVVHASGTPDGLSTALALGGFEATILEMSWYGDERVPAPLGAEFHTRRLRLVSSQVSSVSAARRSRRTRAARLALALDLLTDARYDALLSGTSALDELPETMPRLARGPGPLCHVILYR